jgi:uncharacterized protein (DUF58 family)
LKLTKKNIAQFGNIELLAKQVVEGFITGLHKSPFHGFSVEFAEHRLYNKGESTKHIDWKLYARTDKLFVKRYEEETNLRCQLLIDTSSSMNFPIDSLELNKLEFSVYAAASLIEMLKKQRDAVGLSLFTDELKLETPAKTNLSHHRYIYAELEKLLVRNNQEKNKTTNVVEAIHHFAEKIHKRSLVIIFSDMLDGDLINNEESFSALQHLRHKKHDVVLFHVVDKKKELDLEFENRPYVFVDIESGEEMKLNPNQVKDKYQELAKKHENNLKLKCGQYQIDYVLADINEGVQQILLQYLVKRSKVI